MQTCTIVLKKHEEIRILNGHTWVYSNEIDTITGDIKSGELAYVYDYKKQFLGKGFLNTASKIFVRILTREDIEINEAYFLNLLTLLKHKKEDLGYSNSYRLCFGEADSIPGVVIDKFGDYLSIQLLSLGMAQRKDYFVQALIKLYNPKGIYERSDASVRLKEGLEPFKGLLYGEVPEYVEIYENHLKMTVDIKNGQKTGFFLDQQDNHLAIKPYVKDKNVLDCFSHVGGFGLHAASFGAKKVTCIDSSKQAVETIKRHASMNQLNQVEAIEADVFDYLRQQVDKGNQFDTIVIDPPAFAKKQEHLKKAYLGYKELNLQAMKLITPGGYLYTCSCSHFMTIELFMQMIQEAASNSKKRAHVLELRLQSKDHASLIGSEESLYLKCMIVRIESM